MIKFGAGCFPEYLDRNGFFFLFLSLSFSFSLPNLYFLSFLANKGLLPVLGGFLKIFL